MGEIGLGAAFPAGYRRGAGEMVHLLEQSHVGEPADMTLVQLAAGTYQFGVVVRSMFYHSRPFKGMTGLYRIITHAAAKL